VRRLDIIGEHRHWGDGELRQGTGEEPVKAPRH
jgi:hypothetical protein